MDASRSEDKRETAKMMAWTDPLLWLARNTPLSALTAREAEDEDQHQRTQAAVARAHEAVDTWDARTQMGAALQWERSFWERARGDRQSDDG